MWKPLLLTLAVLTLLSPATSEAGLGAWLARHLPGGAQDVAPPPPSATVAYGDDPRQRIDVWQPRTPNPAPLVVFVHGGAWKYGSKNHAASRWLPGHLAELGYAYAAIDYRLVPAVTVEQQAEDVAHALRALLDRAPQLGIDRTKIVLMGHSAGAHLVALVGTDERYLRAADLGFADLDGVIANDGAAYDVPMQIHDAPRRLRKTYTEVFGKDPARQLALSPVHHAAAPNARAFLLLYVQRPDGVRQAAVLGTALRSAGTAVDFASFPGKGLRGHLRINRELGNPDYAPTAVVDAWLRKIFGQAE
jgi:acetyl esterase/lipase